jgi:hypothetical protein
MLRNLHPLPLQVQLEVHSAADGHRAEPGVCRLEHQLLDESRKHHFRLPEGV